MTKIIQYIVFILILVALLAIPANGQDDGSTRVMNVVQVEGAMPVQAS